MNYSVPDFTEDQATNGSADHYEVTFFQESTSNPDLDETFVKWVRADSEQAAIRKASISFSENFSETPWRPWCWSVRARYWNDA